MDSIEACKPTANQIPISEISDLKLLYPRSLPEPSSNHQPVEVNRHQPNGESPIYLREHSFTLQRSQLQAPHIPHCPKCPLQPQSQSPSSPQPNSPSSTKNTPPKSPPQNLPVQPQRSPPQPVEPSKQLATPSQASSSHNAEPVSAAASSASSSRIPQSHQKSPELQMARLVLGRMGFASGML